MSRYQLCGGLLRDVKARARAASGERLRAEVDGGDLGVNLVKPQLAKRGEAVLVGHDGALLGRPRLPLGNGRACVVDGVAVDGDDDREEADPPFRSVASFEKSNRLLNSLPVFPNSKSEMVQRWEKEAK